MNTRLDSLHSEVTLIKSELDSIKDIKQSLEFTQAEVSDVKSNIQLLDDKIKAPDLRISQLSEKSETNLLETSLIKEQELQHNACTRRENLKFSGIKEEKNESHGSTKAKLVQLLKDILDIYDADDIKFQGVIGQVIPQIL